jgi:hypothetical protein
MKIRVKKAPACKDPNYCGFKEHFEALVGLELQVFTTSPDKQNKGKQVYLIRGETVVGALKNNHDASSFFIELLIKNSWFLKIEEDACEEIVE